jgi:beta-alanine--pyruvate transaminase
VAAAACTTIDLCEREQLFERTGRMVAIFKSAIHKLRGERHVIDVRNSDYWAVWILRRVPGRLGQVLMMFLYDASRRGARYIGDILAFSPPLTIEEAQIVEISWAVTQVLKETD